MSVLPVASSWRATVVGAAGGRTRYVSGTTVRLAWRPGGLTSRAWREPLRRFGPRCCRPRRPAGPVPGARRGLSCGASSSACSSALVALGMALDLPGQPDPQLRPGRPRAASRPSSASPDRLLGLELLGRRLAPGCSAAARASAPSSSWPSSAASSRPPPDPHRGHHRPAQLLRRLQPAAAPAVRGERPSAPAARPARGTPASTVDPLIFGADDIWRPWSSPRWRASALGRLPARTDVGIAIRASAERADRAALLGVPVKRLQTVVWVVAALLAFIGACSCGPGSSACPIGVGARASASCCGRSPPW